MTLRRFTEIEIEVMGSADPESGEVDADAVEQLLAWPKD